MPSRDPKFSQFMFLRYIMITSFILIFLLVATTKRLSGSVFEDSNDLSDSSITKVLVNLLRSWWEFLSWLFCNSRCCEYA